jgi:hypothetical protein
MRSILVNGIDKCQNIPYYSVLTRRSLWNIGMTLVTLDSVGSALEHLEQHNGPGRKSEAKSMLVRAEPIGWVATSPAGLAPAEDFTRSKEMADQYRTIGWDVIALFAEA